MEKPGKRLRAGPRFDPVRLKGITDELVKLRKQLIEYEARQSGRLKNVHPAHLLSARNLLHYLSLRSRDLSSLQNELLPLGFSSLGRSEPCVMAELNAVTAIASAAAGIDVETPAPPVGFGDAKTIPEGHAESLFGSSRKDRDVRIMVTLPSTAATDYQLVAGLIKKGMDIARINLAHDDEKAWAAMVDNIRKASRESKKPCRILMDLAGPKIRTGPLCESPGVIKVRPVKDAYGRTIHPAALLLAPEKGMAPETQLQVIRLDPAFIGSLKAGDELGFEDARGRARSFSVTSVKDGVAELSCPRTAYLVESTELKSGKDLKTKVGQIPPISLPLTLFTGDLLRLDGGATPGEPGKRDASGNACAPARIGITLPEIIPDLKPGHRVFFDDGKIGGVVESAEPGSVTVRITRARDTGSKLAPEKGINLPDTNLKIKGLTEEDISNLPFVVRHADMVALSFVRGPEDIKLLLDRLYRLHAASIGVVLKIETRQALERLPMVILSTMRHHPIGVMIARGDLAVECGYELLAEAQEEILRVCEASHVPVIWATQVLESLNKQGMPSRAEITDAAAAVRADCVMLNKGRFVLETTGMLGDILKRMQAQQRKRMYMLPVMHTIKAEASGQADQQ